MSSLLGLGAKTRVSFHPTAFPTEILEFDASLSETHTGNAEATSHPVETGSDITDHVRRMPEELQINGIVTDDPIVVLRTFNAKPSVVGGSLDSRVSDAEEILRLWKNEGRPLSINTTLRNYTNMVITGFSVTRDKDSGRLLNASLTLREIITATTQTVAPPEPKTGKESRKTKTKKGKQTKVPTPDPPPSGFIRVGKFLGIIS